MAKWTYGWPSGLTGKVGVGLENEGFLGYVRVCVCVCVCKWNLLPETPMPQV